ncbi:MAG: pyridoxal phosphate-dependent aminotransferase [Candidatus Thermoplasmatota archaeon]|nr:pyridoxal phosphate-dependent aminotransferase [Candidatus Thermoplasmatota archaeon]
MKKDDNMIADRMKVVTGSATVKLSQTVAQMRKQGIDVVSFSLGEPDFDTPRNVSDAAIKAINSGVTHYTPAAGIAELREAIAEKSRKENKIPCEAKHVMATPTKFALYATIMATINPGDEVIIPDPSWVSYSEMVKLAGGKPVLVPHEKGWRWNPKDVAKAVTPKTKMIMLNSPSNPTGAVYSKEDIKAIAEIAKQKNLLVLSDEIYEKIIYEGEVFSIASLPGMFERTITVNGLSKSFAMTGWRVGWLIAPETLFPEILKMQEHVMTCVTSFVQNAALEALKGPQDSVKLMAETFKKRRDLILKLVNEIPGFHCDAPKGAFYVFPRYDYDVPSDKFCEFLLKEGRVAVTPGSAFGPSGEKHVRISYAASEKNIIEGMKRIKETVAKLK